MVVKQRWGFTVGDEYYFHYDEIVPCEIVPCETEEPGQEVLEAMVKYGILPNPLGK